MTEHVPLRRLRGAKSGGKGGSSNAGAGQEAPNTLRSRAKIRLMELLGEGEIRGLVDGAKSIYFDDTVLQNKDGTYNFKGVTFTTRVGLPDQEHIPDFPSVETPIGGNAVKVTKPLPSTRTITDPNFDIARVITRVQSLARTNETTNALEGHSVKFRIEARYVNGPWMNILGDQNITGKTTAPYDRSYSIRLPKGSSGQGAPWDVRLTRLSEDETKSANVSDLYYGSLTGVIEAKFSYPYSALIGLIVDAEQFGSDVPVRGYEVYGRIMKVPSNYDPATRVYTGIWNGTFKNAWSDNPAWVLFDVLTNDRFGLGEFIAIDAVDKWSLYQIGAYCDQLVPNGYGGREPRMTFNGTLTEQEEAYKVISDMASAFRGMAYWSAGSVTATQDRPADPDILVTRANTINGRITYQSTAKKARHTSVIVNWRDPQAGYRSTPEVVEDADGIALYGLREKSVDAPWCTSRGQAQRIGRWILFTELYETQIATYRAGLDHAFIRPGMITAIHDPSVAGLEINDSLGGRCATGCTASILQLDRAVTLQSGTSYRVSVVLPSGKVEEKSLWANNATGLPRTSISVTSAFSEVPDPSAVFIITYPLMKPQLFKVITAREIEPHIYEINGLQFQPSKHAYVDEDAKFDPLPINDPNLQRILPPTGLTATENFYKSNGQPRSKIMLSWTPPAQAFVAAGYFVSALTPRGEFESYGRVSGTSLDIVNADEGDYVFYVSTAAVNGKASLAASLAFTAKGWDGISGPTVINLQVKGGGTIFNGRTLSLEWGVFFPAGTPSYTVRSMVRVFDFDSDVLIHQEQVSGTAWDFGYDLNVNSGGPRRKVRVRVCVIDLLGREGTASILLPSNPAPAGVAPTLSATSDFVFVSYKQPDDTDWDGSYIWMSKTPGFNPTTTTPIYDGSDTFKSLPAVAGTDYYIRVAPYDAFSKRVSELNISAEQKITASISAFDPTSPGVPSGLVLSTASELGADGTLLSTVTADWAEITADNLGFYEVSVSVNGSDYVVFKVETNTWTGRSFLPGSSVRVRVRSISQNGFGRSGYSAIRTITSAKSTTAPALPTDITVTAAFETAYLNWTSAPDLDLKWIEIWAYAGTSTAVTPRSGSTMVGTAPFGTTTYADKLGTAGVKTYWLRSVNTSGLKSNYAGPFGATSSQIVKEQLADRAIDATKFAADIDFIPLVTDMPAANPGTGPKKVTFNGATYQWNATKAKWEPIITARGPTGLLDSTQFELDAITKNLADQNQETLKTVTTLPTTAPAAGSPTTLIYQGKLYRWMTLGTPAVTKWYSTSDAAAIDGDIPAARVAGTLTADVISKIVGLTDKQIKDLDGAKLLENTVAGKSIVGYTITASKLNIGTVASNLLPNGEFIDGLTGWDGGGVTVQANAINGGFGARIDRGTDLGSSHWFTQADFSSVDPTLSYETSLWARGGGPSAAGLILRVYWYKADKTASDELASTVTISAGFSSTAKRYSGMATAPSDAAFCKVRVYHASASTVGVLIVGVIQLKRAVGGTLIEDGAITTNHLTSESVTTRTVAAFAITASKLTLIDTTNLVANGEFLDGLDNWTPTGDVTVTSAIPAGGPTVNAACLLRDTAGVRLSYGMPTWDMDTRLASGFPTVAGEEFYVECWVHSSIANAAAMIDLPYRGTAGGSTGTAPASKRFVNAVAGTSVPANTWVKLSAIFTPTVAGKVYPRVLNQVASSTLFVTAFRCQRRNGAQLIVDGSIFAQHVDTDSLKAVLITAENIKATLVTTNRLTADNIGARAITASKLMIASANRVFNADVSQGLLGFTQVNGNSDIVPDALNVGAVGFYAPDGYPALQVSTTGTPVTNRVVNLYNYNVTSAGGAPVNYSVTPGSFYEFTVAASALRCRADAFIEFFNSAGTSVGQTPAIGQLNNQTQGSGDVAVYQRLTSGGAAPATAASARLVMRMISTGDANPKAFFSALMFASVPEEQSIAREFSPYVDPGVTYMDGRNVRTGTIKADALDVTTFTATSGFVQSLSATIITATAISAALVNAGAITTDMLAVGLYSGNQLYNSDFLGGLRNWTTITSGDLAWYTSASAGPQGVSVARISGNPASGNVAELRYNRLTFGGTNEEFLPITPGKRYEFSTHYRSAGSGATVSAIAMFYDSTGASAGAAVTFTTDANSITRSLLAGSLARVGGFLEAPTGATQVKLRIRAVFDGTGTAANYYVTAPYFGIATASQKEFTDWTTPSNTIVDGGNIATKSIIADSLSSKIITTDHISVTGLDASVIKNLKADMITVGGTTLDQWSAGANKTTINGGAIEANSIKTEGLQVGSRGVAVRGIEFAMGRNATTGALTNVLSWTAGAISWTNDLGVLTETPIAAGTLSTGGGVRWVYWVKGAGTLTGTTAFATANGANNVVLASTSSSTGIAVHLGGTVIDGSKITALSISVNQLAANAVNADKIAAGSISTTHIAATGLDAKVINGGTIVVEDAIFLGSTRFRLSSKLRRLSVFNNAGVEVVALGGLDDTGTVVNHGLILRDDTNTVFLNAGGVQQVASDKIKGQLASTQLSAGVGANQYWNADRALGNPNTFIGKAGLVSGMNLNAAYNLTGGYTSYTRFAGTLAVNDYADIVVLNQNNDGTNQRFSVEPGKRYEVSAYLQTLRCNCSIILSWIDGNGTYLNAVQEDYLPAPTAHLPGLGASYNTAGSGASTLAQYTRIGVISKAPPVASQAEVVIRMYGTGTANSYVFFTRLFFGQANTNQMEFSPWVPGGQTVQITSGNAGTYLGPNSIASTYIASLNADKINVTQLSGIKADIGMITAGMLRSADSRFQVDLNARRILIYD